MQKKKNRQQGVSLLIALMMVLLLSTLAASVMLVTNSEVWSTGNYRLMVQARYAAEAGAQRTANWIIYSLPLPATPASFDMTKSPVQYNNKAVFLSASSSMASNYPDAATQTAFNGALHAQTIPGMSNGLTYSTTAELVNMRKVTSFPAGSTDYLETWLITSTGSIAGVRNANVQVQQTIERFWSPLTNYALFATGNTCGSITFAGGATTDSFDSSAGTYATTVQASKGDVGTNGNLSMSGAPTTINGSLSDPNSGTGACAAGGVTALTGSGVTGGITHLSAPIVFPNPPAPSPAPPTTNQAISGSCPAGINAIAGCVNLAAKSISLPPGQYGNLSMSGGTTLHMTAGTYNINSLILSGNSPIAVDSVPVVLNIAGSGATTAIDLTGGVLVNNGGVPSNFVVLYAGSAAVTLAGGTAAYGVVYAPNAAITMTGNSSWFGAVVGKTETDSGGAPIHYDRALSRNAVQMGKYWTTGFAWNKN